MRMRGAVLLLAVGSCLLVVVSPATATTRTETFFSPALTAQPYEATQTGVPLPADGRSAPSRPGWITAIDTDVVDRPAADAPSLSIQDVMIHHLVLYSGGQGMGSLSCGGRFYARGEEHERFRFPAGYGLPNRTADGRAPGWSLIHMLMNHRSKVRTVYVRIKVTYSDEPPVKELTPLFIDTKDCAADPVYDIVGGGRKGSSVRDVHRLTWPQGMSGRIIAAGGHLHGGGRSVDLVNESCGGRTLVHSHAWYGTKDSAFYKVRPILHEASPIRIGIEQSATGIPVSAGDRVALVGTYESSRLHTRVMNILLGYMSREPVPQCAPRPSDVVVTNKPKRYRRGVPRYDVPLVKQPPGAFKTLAGRAVPVGDDYFGLGRITVAAGTPVTWRFEGAELHSVTVANGPRGFSSPWTGNGGSFTFAPKVRGTYRIFCSLHPAAMTQELRVR